MSNLSLTKIFTAIAGILILLNLKEILNVLGPAGQWFAESLDGINNFPQGAQTTIAFFVILLVIVIVLKVLKLI